jgi:hypothetical protein
MATVSDRARLAELTDRWRRRHAARRPDPAARPMATTEREALAASAFPFREVAPRAYVEAHGASMTAYTYDAERYRDPELDAWLLEVGRQLRDER